MTNLSPKASAEVRSLAKGQGSKTSLLSKNSKKSKGSHLPSLHNSVHSSKHSKSKEPLRSSKRFVGANRRNRDNSTTLPETGLRSSRNQPIPTNNEAPNLNSSIDNPSAYQGSQRSNRRRNQSNITGATGSILPAVVQ